MKYSARTGTRDDLVATLRQFQADRLERHEVERAAEAAKAAEQLESGADAAYFERIIYGVGDHDRWTVIGRRRSALTAELAKDVEGWVHMGKPERADEARQALTALSQGADWVRVGHIVYEIED